MRAHQARRNAVIAIDGPAGSGKSTLAARLAEELGLAYVNTGLMYRALTLAAMKQGVDLGDGRTLATLMRDLTFDLSSTERVPSLRIDGQPPSAALTDPRVERRVSRVSRHPEVRALMRQGQRRLGEGGAVMEGRDIGSVVFPDADVKIFLVAESTERARRVRERVAEPDEAESALAEEMAERDERDSRVNPFVPAADAVALDTTAKDADAVFEQAMEIVRRRLPGRP